MKSESFVGSVLLGSSLALFACSSTSDAGDTAGNTAGASASVGGSAFGGGGAASVGAAGATSAGSSGALITGGAGTGGGGAAGSAGAAGTAGTAEGGTASTSAGAGGVSGADPMDPTDLSVWKLSWSDEFGATDGSAPDAKKWTREIRTQGQTGSNNSNKELQQYTADSANSQQKGGALVITALKSGTTYTSARLNTYQKYSAAYGRVEARIKMPGGKGVWPAFWMLGDNKFDAGVGWPKCGEIDIMETKGSQIDTNHGSLHGPVYYGGNDLTATITLPGKPNLSDDFHVYATEWSPDTVKFFVDTTLYETRTPKDMPAGGTWVFNHPFFITLNLAIGGVFDGDPTATTPFPAELLVDYVRVYTAK